MNKEYVERLENHVKALEQAVGSHLEYLRMRREIFEEAGLSESIAKRINNLEWAIGADRPCTHCRDTGMIVSAESCAQGAFTQDGPTPEPCPSCDLGELREATGYDQ